MERFKDFLYNKNDIVVAIAILAVALVIIAFRVMAIMEYPSELAKKQADAVQKVEQQDESGSKSDDAKKSNASDSKANADTNN